MKKEKQTVLCIGSMGKDVFFPLISSYVQTTHEKGRQFCFSCGDKIHVEDRYSALGGCACNVSIGLARLDIDATALGVVGDDDEGHWIMQSLKKEYVSVEPICVIAEAKTDLSMILVDPVTGERTIFVNRDVGEQLAVTAADLERATWCFVGSLYGADVQRNMQVIHHALGEGRIKLVYNPGGRNIVHDETIVLDLIHHAQIVFVNKTEARDIVKKFSLTHDDAQLFDENYLLDVLLQHMRTDDGVVVITDGRRGAWTRDENGVVLHTHTIDKVARDTTGAGDAFASGFVAAALHGFDREVCMQWGAANSDAVIDFFGAQEGLLTYDIIRARAERFSVVRQ